MAYLGVTNRSSPVFPRFLPIPPFPWGDLRPRQRQLPGHFGQRHGSMGCLLELSESSSGGQSWQLLPKCFPLCRRPFVEVQVNCLYNFFLLSLCERQLLFGELYLCDWSPLSQLTFPPWTLFLVSVLPPCSSSCLLSVVACELVS